MQKSEPSDSRPQILLVSHGGFIKTLLLHFAAEERCQGSLPTDGGLHQNCPNTGITRVKFTFGEDRTKVIKGVCEMLFDMSHLDVNETNSV